MRITIKFIDLSDDKESRNDSDREIDNLNQMQAN